MIKKKDLLSRIKSLEEFFDLSYSPSDGGKRDYAEHHIGEYGLLNDLKEMRDEWCKKNKKGIF